MTIYFDDYTNTKITENSDKKRASHPSSLRKRDIHFRKLIDKLEEAETLRN